VRTLLLRNEFKLLRGKKDVKQVESAVAKRLALRNESQRGKCHQPSAETLIALCENRLMPRKEPDPAVAPTLPPAAECAAVGAYLDKADARAPMARTKVEMKSGVAHISFDHANQAVGQALMANAFGTGCSHFASGILGQLANVSRTGPVINATELDFMLTVVRGIGPKDEIEALLAAQMAAIHNATMSVARRLNHVETIQLQDSASNALNKLARTFAAQLEALKRYRSSSEPAVKTQNVTVNDGGQAIVGNVQHGGDDADKNRSISSGESCGAPAPGATLLSDVEEVAPAMSGAGGEGQECLPVPRRPRRRAKRSG
jgi:hypothetical protein